MPGQTRWENRQNALDKKKQLAHKLLKGVGGNAHGQPVAVTSSGESGGPNPRSEASEQPTARDGSAAPPCGPSAQFGRAQVGIRRDVDTGDSKVSRPLAQLVNIALQVAHSREQLIVFQWPGALSTLPLVHALATIERWADGDKQGLRSALFPARANALYPLNHLWLDREGILRLARELIETPGEPNSRVKRSMPAKDSYLTSLSGLGASNGNGLQPTVGELLPLFETGTAFDGWTSCESRLLANIAARLSRKRIKALRSDQCAVIGSPSSAPDALFALNYALSNDDIHQALRHLKKIGAPELLLVDGLRAARRALGRDWAVKLARFVAVVHRTFGHERPGMLLFVDEPQVAQHLRHECIQAFLKLDKDVRRLTKTPLRIQALACSVSRDGLLPSDATEPAAPAPRNITVRATDVDAARTIATLDRYAASLPGGRATAREVVEAADFLHRLSALPSSVRHLMAWLDETEANPRQRDRFTWVYYSGRLKAFVEQNGWGREPEQLRKALAAADEMWRKYQTRTAFAEQLVDAVSAAATSSKHIVVVFDRNLRKRMAERFLEDYEEFPGGKRFSDFRQRVRLVVANELEAQLSERWATQYAFAGLDDHTLRVLVTDDRIPQGAVVLLTRRSAQYLHGVFRRVVEYPEFAVYKPRIESMQRHLSTFTALDEKALLRVDDPALPDFDFQAVLEYRRDDEHDKRTVEIILEGGRRIYRYPDSEVFVYDPSSDLATDRGFRRTFARELKPGDRMFDMSPDLRERVEEVLKEAGVPINRDKKFETELSTYHKLIAQSVAAALPGGTLRGKARALLGRMKSEAAEVQDWPTETAIRQWIDVAGSSDVPFEQRRPQAPRKDEHYFALCKALGVPDVMARYFLYRVIRPLRIARRLDGRYVSDVYAHMLLEPSSVLAYGNLRRSVVDDLFARAMDSIYAVEAVVTASGEE